MQSTTWSWTASDNRSGSDPVSHPIEILDSVFAGYEFRECWILSANRYEILVKKDGAEIRVFMYREGWHPGRVDLERFVGTKLGDRRRR